MYKKIHAFPSIKSVAFSVLSRFHFVTMQKKPIDVTLHFSKKVRFTSCEYRLLCRLIIPMLSSNSLRLNNPRELCWPAMEGIYFKHCSVIIT